MITNVFHQNKSVITVAQKMKPKKVVQEQKKIFNALG